MKKTVKVIILLLIIVLAISFLIGCGNKLVATKSENGCKEKVEIKFKGDAISSVKTTYDFEQDKDAEAIYRIFKEASDNASDSLKVEKKGNRVIVTMNGESYYQSQKENDVSIKEDIKNFLIEQGYTVK